MSASSFNEGTVLTTVFPALIAEPGFGRAVADRLLRGGVCYRVTAA
jgi:hypothetical protein